MNICDTFCCKQPLLHIFLYLCIKFNIKTMEINFKLTEQQLERLKSGKRIPGSLFLERISEEQYVVGFYVHGSGTPKHHREKTLMRMDHGTIRKSARNYKLIVSLPDNLGELRCGELMKVGGEEADNFMRHLSIMLNN